MSKNKPILGTCCVCRKEGKINFEHVPPKSCGNTQTRFTKSSLKDIFIPEDPKQKQRIIQGGIGYYSFCESCNNQFGSWYVKEYSEFYKTAIKVLKIKTPNQSALVYPFEIYPLRIIKQVVCMFLAINHNNNFNFDKDILNEFVLDREKTGLPSQFKIFSFFNRGGKPRILPFTILANINTLKADDFSFSCSQYSEMAFPPLGFVLAHNSKKPDERLVDITYFVDYKYNIKESIMMALPILPTHTKYPCTYKTKGEIEKKYQN